MGKFRVAEVARHAERRDHKTWAWIESRVLPHLQALLDRAQAKLKRHRIEFVDSMGMACLYVEPDRSGHKGDRLDQAISSAASAIATGYEPVGGRLVSTRDARYADRFPELVEFICIINDLDQHLGQSIGTMGPSKPAGRILDGVIHDEFPEPISSPVEASPA